MKTDYIDSNKRNNYAILTMAIGAVVNFGLFFIKMYIGLAAKSLAIMGDGINNIGDTFTCLIAVLSFYFVKKGKSEKLPFGYGRMEYLADFLMSVVVCIAGGVLVYLAVERLVLPYLMTFTWLYFGIIAGTVVVKVAMGFYYRFMNRKVNSMVLQASSIDSFTDAGITAMTLIGFGLHRYAQLRLDAFFGLAIAGIMIFNGIKLLVQSTRSLLGERISKEEEEAIRSIIMRNEQVADIKSVTLHKYGVDYAELVVEVVFTKGTDYDIITNIVADVKTNVKGAYGYETKICISEVESE